MQFNENFVKVRQDGYPEFGPVPLIVVDGGKPVMKTRPTASEYMQCGYLPVVDNGPGVEPPAGYHWEKTRKYTKEGTCAHPVYALVEDAPPAPRIFSKLKCVSALTAAGVWPHVKAFIEEAGLYDLYLAAQDFSEDNEYFEQGREQLQSALGWTDAQVEDILEACVLEK